MNPLVLLLIFLSLTISILSSDNFDILFAHILILTIIVAFNRIVKKWKLRIMRIWFYFPISGLIFFSISIIISDKELSNIFIDVIKSTIRYFGVVSFMLAFTILSKKDDLISALKNLQYKLSIKSKTFDQMILFIDLVIRFYPGIVSQWKNLERGRRALSGYNEKISIREKIKSFSENIPDFIIINLSKTDKLTKSMEMRGYGKKNPRTGYPYFSIKAVDYFILLFVITLIFEIHFGFKI